MRTWADKTLDKLMAKPKSEWTEDDYETWHYIQQIRFENSEN